MHLQCHIFFVLSDLSLREVDLEEKTQSKESFPGWNFGQWNIKIIIYSRWQLCKKQQKIWCQCKRNKITTIFSQAFPNGFKIRSLWYCRKGFGISLLLCSLAHWAWPFVLNETLSPFHYRISPPLFKQWHLIICLHIYQFVYNSLPPTPQLPRTHKSFQMQSHSTQLKYTFLENDIRSYISPYKRVNQRWIVTYW